MAEREREENDALTSLLFTSLQWPEVIVDDGIDEHEPHAEWRQPDFSSVGIQRTPPIRMDTDQRCSFSSAPRQSSFVQQPIEVNLQRDLPFDSFFFSVR